MTETVGKVLYGVLFVVILPGLLILWTVNTDSAVTLPALHSVPGGTGIAGLGLVLLLAGVVALWKVGGGLPMNAYPPPNYVSGGVYGFLSHPIYVGFVFICAGCSIAAGSASGLWLTTPAVAMASAALVMGYELPDMRRRFGGIVSGDRFLPADDSSAPSRQERIRCLLTTLFPWLILYEGVVHRGIPAHAIVAYLPFEQHLPVLPWTEIFYVSVYPAVLLAFFAVSTRATLRLLCIRALVSMAVVIPLFLSISLISPPRPFVSASFLGNLLNSERGFDSAAAAFPSYHVIWAFLVAEAMGGGIRWQRILWRAWAILVSVSCLTTGMHALIDVVGGLLVVVFLLRVERAWSRLRDGTQWIANSWKEWRIGSVRIINHGGFAAAGVFVGILLIETCLGSEKRAIPIAIFVGGTVGAAIWAQLVEGSPALLRPLGFYGGVLGTNFGAILATTWTHTNVWLALSALAVAAPWIQGLGRLRCLVQGCCHGALTAPEIGICYTHPRSRVWRVPELRGVPIHATPLYSLLWNVLTGVVVGRLYLLQVNAAIIGGSYLILSGLGRFVEEAYRGEPQTPVIARLRLYQWFAIATIVAGAIVTTFTGAPTPARPTFEVSSLLPALLCAVAAWFVTGVDFPESNRRFARLT
jgi:membrane-associated phospholipid phosphatase/protein-S-isoprenylcysteine O-methyltransferase Ste14